MPLLGKKFSLYLSKLKNTHNYMCTCSNLSDRKSQSPPHGPQVLTPSGPGTSASAPPPCPHSLHSAGPSVTSGPLHSPPLLPQRAIPWLLQPSLSGLHPVSSLLRCFSSKALVTIRQTIFSLFTVSVLTVLPTRMSAPCEWKHCLLCSLSNRCHLVSLVQKVHTW